MNYCFFNLGGTAHKIGVRQVAYHLWHRYGLSHKVRFVSLDIAPVVNEILAKVDDGQMGVVLKRMMARAAAMAEHYGNQALVTGEELRQVSSQTLTNLRLIDNASDTLILHPLISHDKEHIISLACQICTEEFTKTMPEYLRDDFQKPDRAGSEKPHRAQFDFAILDATVAQVLDPQD